MGQSISAGNMNPTEARTAEQHARGVVNSTTSRNRVRWVGRL
jgi:hypothetical protein